MTFALQTCKPLTVIRLPCCVTGVMVELFEQLFPDKDERPAYNFQWSKLLLGFYLNNLILPVNMLVTYFKPAVMWSGSVYMKDKGRVRKLTC